MLYRSDNWATTVDYLYSFCSRFVDIFVDLFCREVIVLELVENTNLLWQQSDNCEKYGLIKRIWFRTLWALLKRDEGSEASRDLCQLNPELQS